MTFINRPASPSSPYPLSDPSTPSLATSKGTPAPDPQAVARLQALLSSAAKASTSPPLQDEAKLLNIFVPRDSLRQVLQQLQQQTSAPSTCEDQGRRAAQEVLADGKIKATEVLNVLATHRAAPKTLAAFFTTLGPLTTFDALHQTDRHASYVINSSAYRQLADLGDRILGEGDKLKALRCAQRLELREILAEGLARAVDGGLGDDFMAQLATAASVESKAANTLSSILLQSEDEALMPLKATFFDTLLGERKVLSGNYDPGWMRATALLLGSDSSGQLAASLQDKAGSSELTYFVRTTLEHSATATRGLYGSTYYDEDYQRGFDGLLQGLSRLEGSAYTELKAHVLSVASDAMGETYTRPGLTQALQDLFVSDPQGIAMEISNSGNNDVQSPTAFSYLFKQAIFEKPNQNNEFIDAVSATLRDLYVKATNDSLSEAKNASGGKTLGHTYGSLQSAFESAISNNKADQETVRNKINALVGFGTALPQYGTGIGALKDGAVVPLLSTLFNSKHREQENNMHLINKIFDKLEDAMQAGFNGYEKATARRIGNDFNTGFDRVYRRSSETLSK